MANTEHLLKIKATLDTSEVEQKLNKLRSQQTQGSNGTAAPLGGNLNGVLSRLNTSINKLQHSIDGLSKTVNTSAKGGGNYFMPLGVGGVNRVRTISKTQTNVRRMMPISYQMPEFLKTDRSVFRQIINTNRPAWKQFLKGNISANDIMTQIPTLPGVNLGANPLQTLNAYRAAVQGRASNMQLYMQTKKPIVNTSSRTSVVPSKGIQAGQVKAGLSFVGGQLLAGGANLAEATGHTTLAKGLTVGSNVAMGAAAGAAMGSVIPGVGTAIGAAVGAITAGAKAGLDALADSARNTAAAIEKQRASMFTGQALDVGMYKFMQGQNDKAALKKKDVSYFEQRLADAQDRNERQRKALEQEVGLDLGKGKSAQFNLREYEKTTLEMMKGGMKEDNPEIIRRKNVAKLYQVNAKGFQESTSDIENLKEVLEEFKNTATLKTLNTELDKLQEALSSTKAPSMDQVNSLASQGFMIDASDDQQRYQAQIDYLKQIADLTRQIKDKQEQIKTVEIR